MASFIMLFEHCARIPGSITGGDKDEIPPKFVRSIPPNYSTEFKAKRVDIHFDEFLQLKDVNNQFYSSPPIKKKPEILNYGKYLRVKLKEPLLPDMTYTFDFGTAISDLNEGNITTDFLYVFSTGNHVDSLSFSGRILNAFNLRPNGKDDKVTTWVMLYDDLSDSIVYKQPPTYMARADQFGFFNFSHIRPDTFLIFALRDMGGNLIFDGANERIAFSDSLIVIDPRNNYRLGDSLFLTTRNTPDSIRDKYPEMLHTDIVMYQFEEKPSKQYRMAYERKESNMMRFIYSMPVDTFEIEVLDYEATDKWFISEFSANRDTLDYWLTDTTLINMRTLRVRLYSPRTDSINNVVYTNDTLRLNYEPPKQAAAGRGGRRGRTDDSEQKPRLPVETMTITPNIRNNGTMELTDRLQLFASQPIESINTDKIILLEQVDTLKKPVVFNFTRDSINSRKAYLDWKLKDDNRYFLIIDSTAFKSIYGVYNDSTDISFKTQNEDFYSIIEITFDNIPCQIIVQVLKGDKEDLVKQMIVPLSKGNVVTIDYLKPDKYKLKLIYDSNENGIWDTGDYLKKIQPEKVEYFHEPEITTTSGSKTELQWSLKGDPHIQILNE